MSITAAPITSLTLESAPPKIWAEWLWSFFDGSSHYVDGGTSTFPEVQLSFDQGDLRDRRGRIVEPVSGTGITVVQSISGEKHWLTENGRECHADADFLFIIRSKIEGTQASKGNSNYQCRHVSELLHGLLSNDLTLLDLSRVGMTNIEVGDVEVVPTDMHYTRSIRARSELVFDLITSGTE